jgi:3-oxoacyl-[acyl-carrier-protein] synthase-1
MSVHVLEYQTTTAAWLNLGQMREALISRSSGLRRNDLEGSEVDTWIGRVPNLEFADLGRWHSRNNALARACLEQGNLRAAIEQMQREFGRYRVGLILGSSTSSIDRTEEAYRHLDDNGQFSAEFSQDVVHNPGALALFVADYLDIHGPSQLINTACSSSAKVFAAAARWLEADIVDAVLVGGCDALGLSVVHGFDALQLVSAKPCRPLDMNRDGINIGEAAGFALLAKKTTPDFRADIVLMGYGESSDAYHMSHPHPDGHGARQAMVGALSRAGICADSVGYINLHGTSSRVNDTIEAKVVASLFPRTTFCSSTKGWTGHTLGAAGITEAIIALDALITGVLPANLNLEKLDPEIAVSVVIDDQRASLAHVMTNSFGFGGNNCSLIFGLATA